MADYESVDSRSGIQETRANLHRESVVSTLFKSGSEKEEEDRTLTTTWSDAEIMPGRILTTSRPNANAGASEKTSAPRSGSGGKAKTRGIPKKRAWGPRRRTAVGDQRLKN